MCRRRRRGRGSLHRQPIEFDGLHRDALLKGLDAVDSTLQCVEGIQPSNWPFLPPGRGACRVASRPL
jgi:hypothetical protein